MSNFSIRPLVAGLFLACSLTACPPSSVRPLASAVAHAEAFNFKHLLLTKGVDGNYGVALLFNGQCSQVRLAEDALIGAFKNGTYPRTIGGGTVNIGFTFDDLEACQMPLHEVRFPNNGADPVDPSDDVALTAATGDPANPFAHVFGVDADLSSGGVLQIEMFDIAINAHHPSGSAATGSLEPDLIELGGARVGGMQGEIFAKENVSSPFARVNLGSIDTNPDRLAGDFAFVAKKALGDNQLLVVWAGEFVLRTDI